MFKPVMAVVVRATVVHSHAPFTNADHDGAIVSAAINSPLVEFRRTLGRLAQHAATLNADVARLPACGYTCD